MRANELIASSLLLPDPAVASIRTAAPMTAKHFINPVTEPEWDAQLPAEAHRSFFHSSAWAAVLQETYGFTPKYLIARQRGEISAVLPLMEVDSKLTGRRGVSLPFTDECEPLGDDAALKLLWSQAVEHGRAQKWKYLEMRGARRLFPEAQPSVTFYSHELDLGQTEENLFARVDPAVRRGVRKAEKAGVTIEAAHTREAVQIFYALLCRTRKKHGMPPQPFQFFERIHEQIISRKLGVVMLARFQRRPIAGAVYFGSGEGAIYKFGASDESQQQLRGNNLVMWEAIKWHARQGFRRLHLGRTSLANEGLRRFKLNWGAAESRLEYFKYDLRREVFVKDRDDSTGWHNRVFRIMPQAVSRLAGAVLYRHWA